MKNFQFASKPLLSLDLAFSSNLLSVVSNGGFFFEEFYKDDEMIIS